MESEPVVPPGSQPDGQGRPFESGRDQTSQNIETVLDFYSREEQKISRTQRVLERISNLVGQPAFLGFILVFVALWIGANVALRRLGMTEFDPAPFSWLQGIVSLGALLTTTAVLTKQNRLARLAEQRAHLDLKVTLLTEQKAAKLIDLLEELRRDLPNVSDRHDPEAAALQQPMKPDLVLATLDERGEPDQRVKPAGRTREDAVRRARDVRRPCGGVQRLSSTWCTSGGKLPISSSRVQRHVGALPSRGRVRPRTSPL